MTKNFQYPAIITLCLLLAFISTADAETPDITAYNDMMRNRVECRARDHECVIKNAQRWYYFVKTYPTSNAAPQVAMFAARGYEEANEILRNKGQFSEAIQYESLAKEMRTLVTHEPITINSAPQQQTSPTTVRPPEPSKPVLQTSTATPSKPTQPPPPQPSTGEPSPFELLPFLLISLVYPIAYLLLCTSVIGLAPRIKDAAVPCVESIACILVSVTFFLISRSVVFVTLLLTAYIVIRLFFEIGRVAQRRDTLKEQERAEELEIQKATVAAFVPLLNAVNRTYGTYATNPACIPATWYEPRKHYIEEMARSLYSGHARDNSYELWQSGLTPDSPPLTILRVLPFPLSANSNIPKTYEVLCKIATDPTDPAYIIFSDLIPHGVDLLPYLNEERWRPALERHVQELENLVTEEISKQYVVIGTPPDDLPVAYDSLESRYRHTFLTGRSGAGKSTVITNLVAQDMHKGYGVIVMSPDEDLMHRIVPYIPEHRLDDVIYFDPTDTTFPMIGFNPFSFEPPDDARDYHRLKSRKAGETYTILERTLGLSTQEGMQTLLNNAMHALIGRPTATITELRRLLDPKERALHREVANDTNIDDYTREYWETYAAEGANALVYRNLTRRMANLLRPPLFEIFSTHSLSFHREINEHARIILLDLSNFPRDSMEAKITAQLMIATIQQTILRRDKIRKEHYIPYFMYIDEFQNFADTNEKSIGDMAEQLRKYSFGLALTSLVASDLSGRLFDTIIGVMSTFICLSMSAKDARRFADEMSLKHSSNGEFSYESLQKLQVGQAFVKTPPLDTAVFVQMPREPLGNLPKGTITLQQLKNRSKANFGAIEKPSVSPAEDLETEYEREDEPPDIPLTTESPRREPPKKTSSQPPRSKTPHQTPASDSPTIDPKTQPEREAELFDTLPAPEPQASSEPPKKEPSRPAKRKKRNRFDEDVGDAEIEVF